MNKKILTIASIFVLIFTWGCEDYLDINQDPNNLRNNDISDPKVILPAAEVGLGNQLMGWDFGFGGGFWSQYWTQSYTASQFKSLCEYRETRFRFAYQELTAGVLNDLDRIKKLSTDNKNQAYYYAAEVLSIYTWQILTDVWGDIPYFEALKGDQGIESPNFDTGEEIYDDLEKRIDAVLALELDDDDYIEAKYDFFFAGELNYWKQFAASLKLKLMMRLSETPGYDNAAVITFIEKNTFLSKSVKLSGSKWEDDEGHEWDGIWSDGQEGKRHPMREFEENEADYLSTNVIACKTFIDYLSVNSDPRVDVLFEAHGGGHMGAFFGDFDSEEDTNANGTEDEKEDYSTAVFAADQDLIIMSDWEVNFYIAEAYARANNNTKAKEFYEIGVKASLAQHGIESTSILEDGGTPETRGYAIWEDGTSEEGIKQIAMQKWVANANYQHIESFLERNRVKYPAVNSIDIVQDRQGAWLNFPIGELTVSVNGREKTNGNLPSSPLYPLSVLTRNTNAPGQKADLLEKIWWDQKTGK